MAPQGCSIGPSGIVPMPHVPSLKNLAAAHTAR